MLRIGIAATLLAVVGTQGMRMMEPKLGGKSANQIFSDPVVAKLAKAACAGDVAKIDALVAKGVNINGKGLDGAMPLFFALKCEQPAALEAMLKAGADPNLGSNIGITGTYAAASYADSAYLRLMLKYGGDPNKRTTEGHTALAEAFMVGQYRGIWDNFHLLLDAGVDMNLPDRDTGIAVHAATVGLPSKAVELLERGYSYDLAGLAFGIYHSGLNVVTAEQPQPLRDEPEYKYIGIAARILKRRGVDVEKIKRQIDEQDKQNDAGIRHDYSFENSTSARP